jgi:hypothetical protein
MNFLNPKKAPTFMGHQALGFYWNEGPVGGEAKCKPNSY